MERPPSELPINPYLERRKAQREYLLTGFYSEEVLARRLVPAVPKEIPVFDAPYRLTDIHGISTEDLSEINLYRTLFGIATTAQTPDEFFNALCIVGLIMGDPVLGRQLLGGHLHAKKHVPMISKEALVQRAKMKTAFENYLDSHEPKHLFLDSIFFKNSRSKEYYLAEAYLSLILPGDIPLTLSQSALRYAFEFPRDKRFKEVFRLGFDQASHWKYVDARWLDPEILIGEIPDIS